MNREQWLQHAVSMIRVSVKRSGVAVPPVQVSCSWPGGGDAKKRIGECWARRASKANINEVFINPKIEDPVRVLGILTHELAHAVDDCTNGHKLPFVTIAKTMGCEGKPTQMVPPEDVLQTWAAMLVAKHGAYPHRTLDKSMSPVKKQAARMIKCECTVCTAVWRMSASTIATAIGELSCPVCHTDAEGTVVAG